MSSNQQHLSVSPPPLVWFQLLDSASGLPFNGTSAEQVPVAASADVIDFRDAVKAKHSNKLSSVASSQLLVYANRSFFDKRNAAVDEGKEEPLKEDSLVDGLGESKREALIVTVTSSTTTSSASLKPNLQKRYKAIMSVEASCRNYLDAIAQKLASFYEFDYQYTSGPTIGDVLAAKDGVAEGDDWSIRRAMKSYQQLGADGYTEVEIQKGQPLTDIKLPDIYTADEWEKINKFNNKTSGRIHDGYLPSLPNGRRPYIVIPHAEFTQEMISFWKTIGVKASLLSNPDVLEVIDEDVLSDGSRRIME